MVKDRISSFFWRQYGNPRGLFGRFIGKGMARANVYDASWTISLLNIKPESRVLDVGFGPGVSTQLAGEAATNGFVAGIDHSRKMVQAARKRNAAAIKSGRMEIKEGNVSSLPYPDASFDIAFSLHSIYFWDRPLEGIRELQRVLKPAGLLAITIQPKDKWDPARQEDSALRKLFFGKDLVELFSQAGLRDVRVEVSPSREKSLECVLGVK